MKTLTELTARLLDASESMTRYLHDHTEELARGEEPHVFTATNAYAELQEATVDLRHAIELGEALNPSPREDIAIDALIAMHALLLESNPYTYFELAYTRTTGWMAWICSNAREQDPDRKILAQGQGDTAEEACENALDQLTTPTSEPGCIAEAEIPY